MFFFFFQAEDGIRDVAVTGVQTCALPICLLRLHLLDVPDRRALRAPARLTGAAGPCSRASSRRSSRCASSPSARPTPAAGAGCAPPATRRPAGGSRPSGAAPPPNGGRALPPPHPPPAHAF